MVKLFSIIPLNTARAVESVEEVEVGVAGGVGGGVGGDGMGTSSCKKTPMSKTPKPSGTVPNS